MPKPLTVWITVKGFGIVNKAEIDVLLTMPKPLTVWITINYGKF